MFLMLFLLVIVFIFVAFAVDVGRIQLAQLKLQTSSDLAARGAAEALSRGVGDVSNLDSYEAAIRSEADMIMQKNSLFGRPIVFDSNAEISFGNAEETETVIATTGPGNGKGKGRGNGRQKFKFQPSASGGRLELGSNSVRVTPDIDQFPLVFGRFLGRNSVDLDATASAKVQDRDIILVVDRSTSMMEHVAGTIPIHEYPSNLLDVEEALYGVNDEYYVDLNTVDSIPERHSEFEYDSGQINLSKFQALKLAIFNFRSVIDQTAGNEQLGLISYSDRADVPSEAFSPSGPVNIATGLSPGVFDEIVSDGETKLDSTERYASALEDRTSNYDNFDFNYLSMRWFDKTNIVDGIERGVDELFSANSRSFATPLLIVMTDGRHNELLPHNAETMSLAAENAMAAHPNLQIFTITFGDNADQPSMVNVAEIGNGEHFHASDVNQLVGIFRELAASGGVSVIE